MKSTFKFKAFIPTLASRTVFDQLRDKQIDFADTHEQFIAHDPQPTQWRSHGFVPVWPNSEDYVHEISSGMHLMMFQINERNLPGKVRDEHLSTLLEKFKEREGRPVGKKDYAMLKEQAEFDLLPKAFIRRSLVPIIFNARNNLLLIGTSSAKRRDDTVAVLLGLFGINADNVAFYDVTPKQDIVTSLTLAAKEGQTGETQGEGYFYTTASAVLRGEGKRTIRIKDKAVEDGDIQDLINVHDYHVHELGLSYDPNEKQEDVLCTFSISDKMVFKALKFNNGVARVEMGDAETSEQQTEAVIYLTARTAVDIFVGLLRDFGGWKSLTEMKQDAKAQEREAAKANGVSKGDDEEL